MFVSCALESHQVFVKKDSLIVLLFQLAPQSRPTTFVSLFIIPVESFYCCLVLCENCQKWLLASLLEQPINSNIVPPTFLNQPSSQGQEIIQISICPVLREFCDFYFLEKEGKLREERKSLKVGKSCTGLHLFKTLTTFYS